MMDQLLLLIIKIVLCKMADEKIDPLVWILIIIIIVAIIIIIIALIWSSSDKSNSGDHHHHPHNHNDGGNNNNNNHNNNNNNNNNHNNNNNNNKIPDHTHPLPPHNHCLNINPECPGPHIHRSLLNRAGGNEPEVPLVGMFVPWHTELSDPGNMHNPGDATVVTIPAKGLYRIDSNIVFNEIFENIGTRQILILVNNVVCADSTVTRSISSSILTTGVNTYCTVELNVGDIIRVRADRAVVFGDPPTLKATARATLGVYMITPL